MAVSAFKTFSAGEVLTASDLNASFAQVFDNGEDLGWPATQSKDMDGQRLIWDQDQDTYEEATSDDVLVCTVGGSTAVRRRLISSVPALEAYSDATGATAGPYLSLYRDNTGTDSDALGDVRWYGKDDTGTEQLFARVNVDIVDATATSPDGRMRFYMLTAGSEEERLRIGAGDDIQIISQDGGATAGPELILRRDSPSPANNDVIGRLRFDADNSANAQHEMAYIQGVMITATAGSEDADLDFYVYEGGAAKRRFQIEGSDNRATVYDDATGTAVGPTMNFYRDRTSTDNDACGEFVFDTKDAGGSRSQVAGVRATITVAAAGSEEGRLDMRVANGGGGIANAGTFVGGSDQGFAVGKSAFDSAVTAGFEAHANGLTTVTRASAQPMIVNRTIDDGILINFQQGGNSEGNIDVSGTTVALNGFTGNHMSDWADDDAVTPPEGSVVVATDEFLDRDNRHPRCRLSSTAQDPAVWGVFTGYQGGAGGRNGKRRRELDLPPGARGRGRRRPTDTEEDIYRVRVQAVGFVPKVRVVGPVSVGDYLCTSATPGCAEAQGDTVRHSYTLGKALHPHNGMGEGLVSVEMV